MRAWAAGTASAAGRGEDAELLQALEQSALEHALAESRRTAGRSATDAPLEPSGRPDSAAGAAAAPPAVVQAPAAGPGSAAWRLAEDERLARLLQQNEIERQRLQAARVSLSLGKGREALEGTAGDGDRAAGGERGAAALPAGPAPQAAEWPWAALSEAAATEATAAPAQPAPACVDRSSDRPQQQHAAPGPVSLGQGADTSSDEALARALQVQLDLEARAAACGGNPAQDPGPSQQQQPRGAAPGALPAAQPAPHGPPGTPAGAPLPPVGPAGMHAAPWPPPAPPPPPQSKPPLHQLGKHLGAALSLGDAGPSARVAETMESGPVNIIPWSQGQHFRTLVCWLLCCGCLHASCTARPESCSQGLV